jgi:hypothetical protein
MVVVSVCEGVKLSLWFGFGVLLVVPGKSLKGGMDMLIVGLLQGALSYPFFDPVLTGERLAVNPAGCLFHEVVVVVCEG